MSSAADSVRVLHLTDPHLFGDTAGSLRGTVSYASLADVIRHHMDSGWQAHMAACTGDLIQDDSAEAYERFLELTTQLDLPVHCVPGNHDVRQLMQIALASPRFGYCDATEFGSWLIIGLDSCLAGQAGGAINDTEYDRLDAAIAASDAEHVMVCLHHPPVRMGSKWLDTVGLADADRFYARVGASGKVRLAIFGHVHQPYNKDHHGITIIGTPSTCRQFKPGSDEFAVDEQPPAYRRINLHDDGRFDTELVSVAHA